MKIMICGSMSFSREMLQVKSQLEKLGHFVSIPPDAELHANHSGFIDDFDSNYKHCIETDVMRKCFSMISASDCILVLNYAKNGIDGYIGTSGLMEIGLAYYLGKKIFLLNDIPKPSGARWAHEVRIMQPIVLNGDLGRLS